MSNFTRRFLNVLYVRPCVICGKPVKIIDNINLCRKCKAVATRSGQTVEANGRITVSVLPYTKFTRRAMNRFKFSNKKYYGFTFADIICNHIRNFKWSTNIECVVCVPMGNRNRLYNQSEVIAEQVAERLGVPFLKDAMIKVKDNPPFYKLKYDERRRIIKGTFDIGSDISFAYKNVLLIDDIYTTGTTSSECSRVLLLNGAKKVYCATACYRPNENKKSIFANNTFER